MLKRNLILATRIFFKTPLSSIITVGGLSLGIGCFLLLFVYVYNEYQTDRFHQHYDDLYHVSMDYYMDGQQMFSIPPPAGLLYDLIKVPGLQAGSRVFSPNDLVVEYKEHRFLEDGVVMVDSAWRELFDFKYTTNNFELFNNTSMAIVSSSMAERLFGNEDPLGKEVKIGGELYIIENVIVTDGINTSMNINFILPFQARVKNGVDINSYQDGHTPYFVFNEQLDLVELQEKLQQLINDNTEEGFDVRINVITLKESYFEGSSNLKFQNGNLRGNSKYFMIFSIVALSILVMAIINYVNIVTARATTRSKEVGIKKTIGVQKEGLWLQFITESFLITLISGVLAIGLAELALTYFNAILVRPVSSQFLLTAEFLICYSLGLVFISLLAGVYPAFVLSSFRPIGALKAQKFTGKSWLRSALVTIQFSITTLLVFGAFVIFQQVSFLSTIDLGFDKDHIVSIKASDEIKKHVRAVKTDLVNVSGVEYVSTGNLPGIGWMYSRQFGDKNANVVFQNVDEDFVDMAGLTVIEGRALTIEDMGTNNVLINRKLRDLIFKDSTTVFGKMSAGENYLVGVVEDFQFSSVKNEVMPLEMKSGGMEFRDVLLRLSNAADAKNTLAEIKEVMIKHDPETVFEYSFLDEDYNNQFKAEQLFLKLLKAFTVLSIVIAGLGLFGLAQFSFIKNIRNIGIRKILGAPQFLVVFGLLKSVFKPIAIGLLLALPLGFFLMTNWLEGYSNRITIDWMVILFTIATISIITLVTLLYQIVSTMRLKAIHTLSND